MLETSSLVEMQNAGQQDWCVPITLCFGVPHAGGPPDRPMRPAADSALRLTPRLATLDTLPAQTKLKFVVLRLKSIGCLFWGSHWLPEEMHASSNRPKIDIDKRAKTCQSTHGWE
eukprot:3871918-Amphidinium_carterae.2